MVEEAVKSYRVAYERDESGWWVATVRGVRGCHTRGRTVDEARRRIREALELFIDNARRVPIVDDVKLPSAATRAIRGLRDSSQEGRRRRPAGRPRGSTRRPGIANRKTEDERARCRSSAGAVTSARPPAHARTRKPIDLVRR